VFLIRLLQRGEVSALSKALVSFTPVKTFIRRSAARCCTSSRTRVHCAMLFGVCESSMGQARRRTGLESPSAGQDSSGRDGGNTLMVDYYDLCGGGMRDGRCHYSKASTDVLPSVSP